VILPVKNVPENLVINVQNVIVPNSDYYWNQTNVHALEGISKMVLISNAQVILNIIYVYLLKNVTLDVNSVRFYQLNVYNALLQIKECLKIPLVFVKICIMTLV
jgi:hypothetical protein